MAVAAERIRQQIFEPMPLVLVVPEMAEDQFLRHQANRFIGSVATSHEVSIDLNEDPESIGSTMEAIRMAAAGSKVADKMLDINITTDAVERGIKAGIVLDVDLEVDSKWDVSQNGQPLKSVHYNGLRYASGNNKMRSRSEAETRNGFRIAQHNKQGRLKDYNFVTFSCAADDMTLEELKDNKFFVETMSCAIQVTSGTDIGLNMESAFVAGVKEGAEERHDIRAIVKLGALFGVDYSGMTAAEILDTPLLIHKSLMPNGAVDLVKLYDQIIGDSFFGQDNKGKPAQDYVEFKAICKQRIATFASRVAAIKKELIGEAGTIKTPLQAIERLDKLSQKHMVIHAVKDVSIDPRVFGPAAFHIEQARLHEQRGNSELAQAATNRAQSVAKSTSCPSGRQGQQELADAESSAETAKVSDSKTGKINCIKCRKPVNKAEVVKPTSWRCPSCKYEVDICTGAEKHKSEPPKKQEPLTEVISLEEKRRELQIKLAETAVAEAAKTRAQVRDFVAA